MEDSKFLKALVVLQFEAISKLKDVSKPELLLSRAGLTAKEISEISGKSQAAVAKAIERSKKAARTVAAQPDSTVPEDQVSN